MSIVEIQTWIIVTDNIGMLSLPLITQLYGNEGFAKNTDRDRPQRTGDSGSSFFYILPK